MGEGQKRKKKKNKNNELLGRGVTKNRVGLTTQEEHTRAIIIRAKWNKEE